MWQAVWSASTTLPARRTCRDCDAELITGAESIRKAMEAGLSRSPAAQQVHRSCSPDLRWQRRQQALEKSAEQMPRTPAETEGRAHRRGRQRLPGNSPPVRAASRAGGRVGPISRGRWAPLAPRMGPEGRKVIASLRGDGASPVL